MWAQRTGCHPPRTGVRAQAGPARIPVPSSLPQGRARRGLESPESPFLALKPVDRPVQSPRPFSAPSSPPSPCCDGDKAQLPNCCLGAPPTADRQRRKLRCVPTSSLARIPRLCQGQQPKPSIRLPQGSLTSP